LDERQGPRPPAKRGLGRSGKSATRAKGGGEMVFGGGLGSEKIKN